MSARLRTWVMAERGRLARFLIVGGGFSLIYSMTTAALISHYNAPAFLTSVLVWTLCVPAAFVMQKRFTFQVRQAGLSSFAVYLGTQIASLTLVSSLTTRFVTGTFAFDTGVLLVTAGSAAVLSFAANRYFAFRPAV